MYKLSLFPTELFVTDIFIETPIIIDLTEKLSMNLKYVHEVHNTHKTFQDNVKAVSLERASF